MSYYSNPTESRALGAINKDWARLKRLAKQIRRRRLQGMLSQQELANTRREFVGIYRILLVQAMTLDKDPEEAKDSKNSP